MSKHKHIPGPWEFDEAGSWKDGKRTSTEYFVRRPGDDVAIASDIIDPANDDQPSKANAHLITAAPDLLEALESIVKCLEYSDDAPARMDMARAAIAKAKGEAT